jgi:lipoprotein-anchoring transpeptidase ErfK/SrfK
MNVKEGDIVQRHQQIATIGQCDEDSSGPHLHLQLRRDKYTTADEPTDGVLDHRRAWIEKHFVPPTQFINEHRKLFIPQQESTLVLVDEASYRMRLYHGGNLHGEYNVSFGQAEGQKRAQGDNKTPKGMYFIVQKHRGNDFPGPYGGYYGKHWMKINYPNKYDAAWGRSQGVITAKQEQTIAASWQKRAATLENTDLGGGIGFHGWINEWDNRGPRRLSWGCVVMHISDVTQLFDQMPEV